MSDLKTDYLNDILDASMNGKRHYNIVDSDGNIVQSNVTLEDVTSYTQLGSNYDASDVNEQNGKINEIGAGLEEQAANVDVQKQNRKRIKLLNNGQISYEGLTVVRINFDIPAGSYSWILDYTFNHPSNGGGDCGISSITSSNLDEMLIFGPTRGLWNNMTTNHCHLFTSSENGGTLTVQMFSDMPGATNATLNVALHGL